jgi:glycerophosphoryl diester phosphodiesterase
MPDVPVSGILDGFAPENVSAYRAKGYRHISLNRKTVTRELIERCREMNISVYIWTVDDEEEMKKFISWGADGIYSNDPRHLRAVVG